LKRLFIVTFTIAIIFSGCTFGPYYPEVPRITKEELKKVLTDPEIIIIDVRKKKEWDKSDKKLPGAVWEEPKDPRTWAGNYPKNKHLVFY
jgi:3-mercaptopyruvate sulfurtransferase SseA